jgi:hypothetical protein
MSAHGHGEVGHDERPGGHDEHEERRRDEKELDAELERMPEASRQQVEETRHWVVELSPELANLERAEHEQMLDAQAASPDPIDNIAEVVPDDNPALRRQNEALREMLQPMVEDHARARRSKWKYLLWVLNIAGYVGTAFAIYDEVKKLTSGSPPPDAATASLLTAARTWLGEEDTKFWDDLADYVDANQTSLEEQILFMQYTEDIYLSQQPPPKLWVWESAADKADLVNTLAIELPAEGIATVYRSMPTRTYNSVTLRRDIAADVLSLAFAQVAAASVLAGS